LAGHRPPFPESTLASLLGTSPGGLLLFQSLEGLPGAFEHLSGTRRVRPIRIGLEVALDSATVLRLLGLGAGR
jgi:hypothetical protein